MKPHDDAVANDPRTDASSSDRRYRLISSRRHGSVSQVAFDQGQKHVEVPSESKLRLCQLKGRGRIVRFWMTLPVLGRGAILRQIVLRMYWDGEATPSVEVPLGDFFGAAFGKPVPFVSAPLVVVGGAYLSRFAMPFNEGAVVEIANESRRTLRHVFFQIGYYEEPARTRREPTLHAQFRRQNPTTAGEPFVALEASGKGWLSGLRMDIQTRAWWLKRPLSEIPLPRGFGLGVLEGWETIVVDEQRADALIGTGAEDYFSGGFYFKGVPFCTPTHGCTKRSFLTGRVSAYRFHIDDPIYFARSIELKMDHGLKNSMEGDYCSVAYWYQEEPHAPFPALPSVRERQPIFAWMNIAQWMIVMAVLSALASTTFYLLSGLARGASW